MTEHDTAHGEFLLRFLQVQDGLRAAALSLCGDPHQADDLFQETTMACWRSYDRYDPERPFGAWARGVLRNVAHAHWRKQAKAGVSLSQEAIESIVGAHAACDDSGDWRIEALRSCLAGLGPRARELLRLRYTEDLGREAIAERLAASVDAVKKGMTRARSALARCIEQRRVTT